jgi:hypothetical protein
MKKSCRGARTCRAHELQRSHSPAKLRPPRVRSVQEHVASVAAPAPLVQRRPLERCKRKYDHSGENGAAAPRPVPHDLRARERHIPQSIGTGRRLFGRRLAVENHCDPANAKQNELTNLPLHRVVDPALRPTSARGRINHTARAYHRCRASSPAGQCLPKIAAHILVHACWSDTHRHRQSHRSHQMLASTTTCLPSSSF